MGEKNNIMCEYLSKPEIFADFINVGYFHGKRKVLPQELMENSQISYENEGKKAGGERSRDVIKVDVRGRKYAIIGIEDQEMVNYAMPFRCMEYDVREYRRQLSRLKEKNLREDKEARKNIRRGERTGRKMEPQEFLSGMRKTDKLNPVITIVFYHGKVEYDGCIRLHDMLDLEGENSIFKDSVADYKMNPVTLENFEEEKCESGLRELAGFLKCRQSREKLKEYCNRNRERIQNMDEDTYNVISVMMDRKDLIEVKEKYCKEEGDGFNMCKAMEDWAEELLEQGNERGLRQGIEGFIAEFREDGKTDEQIAVRLMKRFSLSEAEAFQFMKTM